MRAIPKRALETKMRALTDIETAELEMATDEALGRLRKGIPLDGHRTLPATVVLVPPRRRDEDAVLLMTIREGRNRQVRRMCEAVGHPVQTLKRTRVGPISDRRLKPGDWRELTDEEVAALKKAATKPTGGSGESDKSGGSKDPPLQRRR